MGLRLAEFRVLRRLVAERRSPIQMLMAHPRLKNSIRSSLMETSKVWQGCIAKTKLGNGSDFQLPSLLRSHSKMQQKDTKHQNYSRMDGVGFSPSRFCSSGGAVKRVRVAWVSQDPLSGKVWQYPKIVAKMIEASYQRGDDSVFLGELFADASVDFRISAVDQPFQLATPFGKRDVFRVILHPVLRRL